jgi:hypothetical protein
MLASAFRKFVPLAIGSPGTGETSTVRICAEATDELKRIQAKTIVRIFVLDMIDLLISELARLNQVAPRYLRVEYNR